MICNGSESNGIKNQESKLFFLIDLIYLIICDLWFWMVCVWFNHFVCFWLQNQGEWKKKILLNYFVLLHYPLTRHVLSNGKISNTKGFSMESYLPGRTTLSSWNTLPRWPCEKSVTISCFYKKR